MKFETLEELVKQRRGYKYLNKDWTSPYKKFQYNSRKRIFKTDDLDTDLKNDCGAGFNLATLGWILEDSRNLLNQIIVEYSIPKEATIIIPTGSTGKFRTDIIKKERIHKIDNLFPELKNIQKRLRVYKPTNPITSKKLPDKNKIRKIMAQIWVQVWDQVGYQVRAQIWDQVWVQVGAQVWDHVVDQVWAQVWIQVWDPVGAQVRAPVGAHVWDQIGAQVVDRVGDQVADQVRAQVAITAYFAVKEFLNLDYEHPAFDLIRLGIFVVQIGGKFKVFGKGGMFLGEVKDE